MKNICLFLLLTFFSGSTIAQDLTFDSVAVISPYWGLRIESGTSGDPWMNCGQTNTNFATGQPYLLARFPVRLVNMGNSTAYFGTYGVTPGITHDSCYDNQFTQATDYINIPNFVLASVVDSCGNLISSSRKTDWNIQNNSPYAVSKYNGQWTYLSNYFGSQPTTGNAPNLTKDWLESLCGPIDTNIAILGRSLMDTYYNGCLVCDSLVIFPNYASDDYSVIQLPTNLSPGNYKLILSGNFSSYESSNCFPNTIEFPFNWDGAVGQSTTYPYFANGITYLSAVSCTPPAIPSAPTDAISALNNGTVSVQWTSNTGSGIYFEITPILVQGNTERRIINRMKTSSSTNTTFDATQLRQDAIALGSNSGSVRYRFGIKASNGNITTGETKTKTINVK